jgi:CheY-like chemotaxis protein
MKIVAISSFAVKGAAAEIQKAGFDAFLPKPIINSELLSVMCTVLGDNRPDGQIITKHLASDLACKGIKVLVAEDNPVNRKLLQVLLKNLECKVHMSENGREAVEELKINTYDIVLMDNQMPVMGGLEATKVIRAEISKDLPVLGLSASVMKEDQEKGLTAGMSDYLTKPINPKKLKESLLKWSGRS